MTEPDFVIPFDSVPDSFAESVENPPAVPVTPRPAATIVLLRDASRGLEVLLMRRNRRAGFVPGAYVFPGGRVDRDDAEPQSIERLEGLDPAEAERRLGLVGADPPAIAYYLAALREAFEETGILVGHTIDGGQLETAAQDAAVNALREALMEERITFGAALDELRCHISGDAIEYLAHWITPRPEPRRYDTRFFAARVHAGAEPIVDPREMTEAVWIEPEEALNRVDEGRMPMVFPTIKTLEQLMSYRSADEALSAIASAPVRTILPTLVITPTGIGMKVDSDE